MGLEPKIVMWSVAVGNLPLNERELRKIAYVLGRLDGFLFAYPQPPDGTLLFFDSEDNATLGRIDLVSRQAETGRNICRWVVAENGVPEFDEEWAKAHGMEGRDDG